MSPVPLLEEADVSLLDVIDHVLNQGVVISGELTLGVADVDLIYVRLLALVCSADRMLSSGADSCGASTLLADRRGA
jgi:gas vesicle structural protein